MEAPTTGRSRPDSTRETLATLKSRAFPQRVRAILDMLLGHLSAQLEHDTLASLDAFEQALFRRAEQARNNDEQQRCFESLREVRRVRSDIAPSLVARFEAALAHLNDPRRQSALARPQRGGRNELSLVDSGDLEETLVLVEAANRAEVRSSQELFALGMRFAALAEAAMFEPEDLPIGPHKLSECLRLASSLLELPNEHRLLFFRSIDQCLFGRLDKFYEDANRILLESRVLPDLVVMSPRARRPDEDAHETRESPPTPSAPTSSAATHSRNQQDVAPGMPSPASATITNTAPVASAQAPTLDSRPSASELTDASARFQQRGQQTRFGLSAPPATTVAQAEGGDEQRFGGFARPLTGWPGVPANVPRESASNEPNERQMFQTMREMLSGRRQALGLGAAPAQDPNAFSAKTDDLQSVLGVLQQRPAMPLSVGGKLVQRSIGHVKQDILNQLRQVTPEGQTPRLQEEDADTIDLVGLLFDNLAKHGAPNATVSQLMTKLQVPLLRVALRDKSFFSKRSHPARQLLNAVAESGLYWLDEGEEDRPLVEKMQGVVDRVLTDFHDDPAVFENVLGDLSRHLQTQARKSEVAERRHVDAARGREKLESARQTAINAIAAIIGKNRPRALIRTLLEQAWTDVLALTVLRQGEDSSVFRERLQFVDGVIAFGEGKAVPREPLRTALEAGLAQVGFHVEDIQAVADRLFGARDAKQAAASNDDPATLTEVAARLKAHSRFGEEGDHHPHHHAHKPHIDPPINAAETQIVMRLKSLPFGTWFEVTPEGNSDRVRRKLSWFSTLTGRCLFVNQRGARTHESSLEQLARDIHENRAKVYEEPSENLIDRAWHAIVRTLKTFTGQAGNPTAEAN